MLAPALVLVVLVLGAIAVDLSLAHTARRSAYRSLSAAADDAAGMIDQVEFQRSGIVRLDPQAARRVARAHLGLLDGEVPEGFAAPAFEVLEADVDVDVTDATVRIDALVEIPTVMMPAIAGLSDVSSTRIVVTGRML
ncbi:MAG: hypothetical protein ACK5O2_13475 [Microthrixaceae bacterium]